MNANPKRELKISVFMQKQISVNGALESETFSKAPSTRIRLRL